MYLFLFFYMRICALALFISIFLQLCSAQVTLSGELRKWHTLTLNIQGPQASEAGNPNPFLDYRLEATFLHDQEEMTVPGYFAADGNAANSGATTGNIWKVHFTPTYTGNYTFTLFFKKGSNTALGTEGSPVESLDGLTGGFSIIASNKQGRDFRAKGRLIWNQAHYWNFQGSDIYFIKGGTDSPENFFGSTDFDNTKGARTHNWASHIQDWQTGNPTWKNERGKGIIGAVNYLASKGLNSIGPITMAINGDVGGIYPYISDNQRERFDCSKLDQWFIVIDHAQKQGIHFQFKLSEHENYNLDGISLNDTHKLYYREMVARFGHFLAISWNIGEEFGTSSNPHTQFARELAGYLAKINPYAHNITIHNWGGRENQVFDPQMGNHSSLTGTSLQGEYYRAHSMALEMRQKSAAAGKPWIIAHDEQPPVNRGLPMDNQTATSPAFPNQGAYTQDDVRKEGLWGHLMAGGAGMEWFWGTDWPENQTDFEGSDYRSRDQFWNYVAYALNFFENYLPFHEMENANELIGNHSNSNDKFCFAKIGEIYAVYLPNGGSSSIELPDTSWQIAWYNPRNGTMGASSRFTGSLSAPDQNDWVALISLDGVVASPNPSQAGSPSSTVNCQAPFTSKDGLVIIEAENTEISEGWLFRQEVSGYSANGYLEFVGENRLNDPGYGVLTYKFFISTPGIYRFEFRSRVGYGDDTSEHNDTFIAFPDADFYGQLDGTPKTYPAGKGTPTLVASFDGWVKAHSFGTLDWSYRTKINDHSGYDPFVEFTSRGVYTLQLSGRSKGHLIDRLVLFQAEIDPNELYPLTETLCEADQPMGSLNPLPSPTPLDSFVHYIPKRIEAEDFIKMAGIQTEPSSEGTEYVGWFDPGDFVEYMIEVPQTGLYNLKLRLASEAAIGQFELYIDNQAIVTADVPNTGSFQTYQDVLLPEISLQKGRSSLRLQAITKWFNINWLEFSSDKIVLSEPGPLFQEVAIISPQDGTRQPSVTIQWALAASLAPESVTEYELQINDQSWVLALKDAPISDQMPLGDLAPGAYLCRIRARMGTQMSAWSAPVSFFITQ